MRVSSSGRAGFNLEAESGGLFRMALKTAAEVSPAKGNMPVAIS
jgi:hypothetical protein